MARTTDTHRSQEHRDTMARHVLDLVNALADELSALYAKLDADAGVTDANYRATLETAHKLGVFDG